MNKNIKSGNWDRFWEMESSQRFTRKSWSKIRIIKVLEGVVLEGMEILDAGCGSGFFSAYFLSKGCRVWALDYSGASLEIARKNTQGRCQAYLKENLFLDDWMEPFRNKFDLIFSDGLFEHFSDEDQQQLMGHFKMLKKKNGIIATFVPNRYSWWEILRPLVMPGIHEIPFTPAKVMQLHRGMHLFKTGGLNVLPVRFSPERLLGSRWGMILYGLASH
ncbi:MAG: class I SAM-dependent methyltransferase [Candidatus Omnitrophota bacterium]